MSLDVAKNFAKATVSTGYNNAATSIVLTTGHGARMPAVPFNATWWDSTAYPDPSDDPNVEIVRVTAISTDTLTITRAQESTSASNKNTGGNTYAFLAGLTAKVINTDLALVFPQIGGFDAYCPARYAVVRGAPFSNGGSFTWGIKFFCLRTVSLKGVRFGWATAGSSKTCKVSLWDNGTNSSGTTFVDSNSASGVNASGLYEIDFTAPLTLTAGHYYTIGVWETGGSVYVGSAATDVPAVPYPYPDGPILIILNKRYAAGDNMPSSDGGDAWAAEPVFV